MSQIKKAIVAFVGSVLMLLAYFGIVDFGEDQAASIAESVAAIVIAIGTVFGVWKSANAPPAA